MPGLENDAHASLADLSEQLVFIKLAGMDDHGRDRRSGAGRNLRRCTRSDRPADLLYLVAVVEVLPQFLGELGVPGEELLPVDSLAAVQALHVLAQYRLQ